MQGGNASDEQREEKVSGDERCCVTSLVLQISPRVAPQAFPGTAFHGMIPGIYREDTNCQTRTPIDTNLA